MANEPNDRLDICEFLCSKCGNIPEILNVHTDNSKIEFNCKKCGIYEILIDDYYNDLFQNQYFKKCNKCPKRGIYNSKFYYCSNCNLYLCENCKRQHNREHKCKEEKKKDHYFFNRCICGNTKIKKNNYYYCLNCKNDICEECKDKKNCINKEKHQTIDENEKKNTCLEHGKTFINFCLDCRENSCESCSQKHENHKNKALKGMNTLTDVRDNIIEINEELKNLVEFNETILKYTDVIKDNYDYSQSIINIGKSLKEGNERNSNDIKCLLQALSQDIKNSNKAIKDLKELKFENKRKIQLSRKEKYIHLNGRKLNDQAFEYISQIRFNQLKEIDISENNITNIQPFKKMSLPFLEFLNLSHNKIKKIEPVSNLKCGKLQYIFLQHNKIEDIETLSESDFPSLRLLRAEDYDFDLNITNEEIEKKQKEAFKKIDKKYSDKFIHKPIEQQKTEFKKNYDVNISWDKEKLDIDLSDLKGGDKMLQELFLIITYMPNNKIRKLSLRNNDIKDPSLLNRINFNHLEELDLAVNYIKDLEFLQDIKAKKLKHLFIDNNEFEEIYHILKANFQNLEIISLNENQFDSDEMETSPIYLQLEQKTIENEMNENFGKRITIQLKKREHEEEQGQNDTDKESKPKDGSDIEKSKENQLIE